MTQPDPARWLTEYETGIRAIDNDHKGLFEDIRFLGEAMARGGAVRQIESAIESLEKYCREHFAREEAFMIGARYPETEAHIREHRRMTGRIARLHTVFAENPRQVDGRKVYLFLTDWLATHIVGADMRYTPYLIGNKHSAVGPKDEDLRRVTISVPQKESKVVADFVRIIESDHPVAKDLARAIAEFEKRLEKDEIADAKALFCR
jgi:hemerythrin